MAPSPPFEDARRHDDGADFDNLAYVKIVAARARPASRCKHRQPPIRARGPPVFTLDSRLRAYAFCGFQQVFFGR
jgi:hypothetical protein